MAQDYTRALADLDRDGYVVLENVIESELVGELKEALLKVEHDTGITGRDTDFEGRQTIRIYNLLAHGESFWKVPIHPQTLPFAEAVLDDGLQVSSLTLPCAPGRVRQSGRINAPWSACG